MMRGNGARRWVRNGRKIHWTGQKNSLPRTIFYVESGKLGFLILHKSWGVLVFFVVRNESMKEIAGLEGRRGVWFCESTTFFVKFFLIRVSMLTLPKKKGSQ
jgi:hypothetical protein